LIEPDQPSRAARLQANADLQWHHLHTRGAWVSRAVAWALFVAWPLADGDTTDAWHWCVILLAFEAALWASWWHAHRKARRAAATEAASGD
jgi:hypothetical protein